MAGLGLTAVLASILFAFGLRPDDVGDSLAFIFVQFFGQLSAGYVAGRFSHPAEAFHGSQAGLALYGLTAILTLSTGGEPGLATIVLSAFVALVVGSAGGVLAAQLRRA